MLRARVKTSSPIYPDYFVIEIEPIKRVQNIKNDIKHVFFWLVKTWKKWSSLTRTWQILE